MRELHAVDPPDGWIRIDGRWYSSSENSKTPEEHFRDTWREDEAQERRLGLGGS